MPAQDALFDTPEPAAGADAPLAERLRPRHLDQVVGQRHLLAPGRPLRVAFEAGRLPSMILWGPPGVGKTTLARLLAGATGAHFIVLSAVLAGVKDIRDAVEQAQVLRKSGRATVLFVDEVHRFNKAQQDAFLPHVEAGLFSFIGATTENPSFEVNSALLSRATVHVLEPLDEADLGLLIDRARAELAAPPLDAAAREKLVNFADGDGRRLLNALENVVAAQPGVAEITPAHLEAALGRMLRRGDKGGDVFYDLISALHKSVRGSNPDGALYWLARMLDAGADPRYAARRIVRMASEDIGLADPRALRLALDAAEVFERLGSPEGELALAAGGGVPGRGAQVQRRLQGLERGQGPGAAGRLAPGAPASAQCAHAADEGHGLWRRLPLCTRRGRMPTPLARPTCPRACKAVVSTIPCRAGWSCASERNWPSCAARTMRRRPQPRNRADRTGTQARGAGQGGKSAHGPCRAAT
jgi:putative ATPase